MPKLNARTVESVLRMENGSASAIGHGLDVACTSENALNKEIKLDCLVVELLVVNH